MVVSVITGSQCSKNASSIVKHPNNVPGHYMSCFGELLIEIYCDFNMFINQKSGVCLKTPTEVQTNECKQEFNVGECQYLSPQNIAYVGDRCGECKHICKENNDNKFILEVTCNHEPEIEHSTLTTFGTTVVKELVGSIDLEEEAVTISSSVNEAIAAKGITTTDAPQRSLNLTTTLTAELTNVTTTTMSDNTTTTEKSSPISVVTSAIDTKTSTEELAVTQSTTLTSTTGDYGTKQVEKETTNSSKIEEIVKIHEYIDAEKTKTDTVDVGSTIVEEKVEEITTAISYGTTGVTNTPYKVSTTPSPDDSTTVEEMVEITTAVDAHGTTEVTSSPHKLATIPSPDDSTTIEAKMEVTTTAAEVTNTPDKVTTTLLPNDTTIVEEKVKITTAVIDHGTTEITNPPHKVTTTQSPDNLTRVEEKGEVTTTAGVTKTPYTVITTLSPNNSIIVEEKVEVTTNVVDHGTTEATDIPYKVTTTPSSNSLIIVEEKVEITTAAAGVTDTHHKVTTTPSPDTSTTVKEKEELTTAVAFVTKTPLAVTTTLSSNDSTVEEKVEVTTSTASKGTNTSDEVTTTLPPNEALQANKTIAIVVPLPTVTEKSSTTAAEAAATSLTGITTEREELNSTKSVIAETHVDKSVSNVDTGALVSETSAYATTTSVAEDNCAGSECKTREFTVSTTEAEAQKTTRPTIKEANVPEISETESFIDVDKTIVPPETAAAVTTELTTIATSVDTEIPTKATTTIDLKTIPTEELIVKEKDANETIEIEEKSDVKYNTTPAIQAKTTPSTLIENSSLNVSDERKISLEEVRKEEIKNTTAVSNITGTPTEFSTTKETELIERTIGAENEETTKTTSVLEETGTIKNETSITTSDVEIKEEIGISNATSSTPVPVITPITNTTVAITDDQTKETATTAANLVTIEDSITKTEGSSALTTVTTIKPTALHVLNNTTTSQNEENENANFVNVIRVISPNSMQTDVTWTAFLPKTEDHGMRKITMYDSHYSGVSVEEIK